MLAHAAPLGTLCAFLQVRGVLDKEEVLFAKNDNYLFGVHVVVGLPATLAELVTEPNAYALFRDLRIIAVDEADACFQVCIAPRGSLVNFVSIVVVLAEVHVNRSPRCTAEPPCPLHVTRLTAKFCGAPARACPVLWKCYRSSWCGWLRGCFAMQKSAAQASGPL